MLAEALRLVDVEGLDALTMRRLGRELGVEAMSVYHHVPGKEALLGGIVELIVLEIEVADATDGSWQETSRRTLRSYRKAALAHPHAFPLFTTRPLNTQGALRRMDATFGVLRAAGFDDRGVIAAFRLGAGFVRGFALEEINARALGRQPPSAEGRVPGDLADEDFPNLSALAASLASADADELFEIGVEAIIAGMQARLDGLSNADPAPPKRPIRGRRAAPRGRPRPPGRPPP